MKQSQSDKQLELLKNIFAQMSSSLDDSATEQSSDVKEFEKLIDWCVMEWHFMSQ